MKAVVGRSGNRMRMPTAQKLKGLQFQRDYGVSTSSFWAANDTAAWAAQLTRAQSLGANSIKWASTTTPVTSGLLTTPTFLARIGIFLDLCAERGQTVYWTLFDGFTDPIATDVAARAVALDVASYLQTRPEVVGLDGMNETVLTKGDADSLLHAQTLTPALRQVTDLPISYSLTGGVDQFVSAAVTYLNPYVDFYDFHTYYGEPRAVDLAAFRSSPSYKPWVNGETGLGTAATPAQQRAHWTAVGVLSAEPDCFGTYGYCIDSWGPPGDDYGVFDGAGVARPQLSEPFAAWPGR